MHLEAVGKRIKQRRIRLGITQQELAEAAGYTSKVAICRIESGKLNLSMDKLVKISERLGCKVSDLMPSWRESDPDVQILPPGTFHGGQIQTEPHAEIFHGLDKDDIERLRQYADLLRRAKWQQLSGTEEDGASESAKEEKSDPSHQRHQDDLEGVK